MSNILSFISGSSILDALPIISQAKTALGEFVLKPVENLIESEVEAEIAKLKLSDSYIASLTRDSGIPASALTSAETILDSILANEATKGIQALATAAA
ncbi:MAG TPA: hypothetical protein VGL56_14940 [Fimbriimonadaceae bacterium]|jgi:hypothetical protein